MYRLYTIVYRSRLIIHALNLGLAGVANRAGYTSIKSKARLTFAWNDDPIGSDGRVPLFAQSVNVYFRLTDFIVAISSDLDVRSCAYRATHRHEFEAHIYDPIRIFHSYRDILVRRLNNIAVPTRQAPLRVLPSQVESRQLQLEHQIRDTIGQTMRELSRALQSARASHDSPASYRLVYNQCSAAEWRSGR